jgi:hypothetical protein
MLKTITVTAQDIRSGQPKNSRGCPVALAMKRSTQAEVFCGVTVASVNGGSVSLPLSATTFIRAFDHGDEVQPFSFTVEVPDAPQN